MSKHKRNLAIAGGVTLSVIVSPVVAAVTVGKKYLKIAITSHFVELKFCGRILKTRASYC